MGLLSVLMKSFAAIETANEEAANGLVEPPLVALKNHQLSLHGQCTRWLCRDGYASTF